MNLPPVLRARLDVSRETGEKLAAYVALVEKWQPRVNLVSSSTLPEIWTRHIWDSAQLAPLVPAGAHRILDVGSGAGFPGLVLAALCDAECHLVESDQKKAIFLQTVVRECGIPATIHTARIESLPSLDADIITARALAPMDRLLDLLAGQLSPGTRCLFLKGAQAEGELAALGTRPELSWQLTPSLTNPDAFVVNLTVST